MKADHYHGQTAKKYDGKRDGTAKRVAELVAVEAFVDRGPVIDVACGTGACFPIYLAKRLDFVGVDISRDMLAEARRKFPGVDVRQGSALSLSVPDGAFATAVSIRFLEWLPADLMKAAVAELKRVAEVVVATIRLGPAGEGKTFTHPRAVFYEAIDGLLIEDRRIVSDEGLTTAELFKLRPATWWDAVAGLAFDYPETHKIQLRSDKFGAVFGIDPVPITAETTTVRAEYWTSEEIGKALLEMSRRWDHTRPPKHRFIHDKEPRNPDLPATIVERSGVRLIIDGRHRANKWMKQQSRHPVIVVRPR
jgi:SAM-dependent methyltransferase